MGWLGLVLLEGWRGDGYAADWPRFHMFAAVPGDSLADGLRAHAESI
jgi:hypothetical protein